jgi:hypothetical protein
VHVSGTTVGMMISACYAATAVGSPLTKRVAANLPVPVVLTAAAVIACTVMLVVSQTADPVTVTAALGAGALVPGLLVALVVPAHGWRTAMLIAALIALAPIAVAPLIEAPRRPDPPPAVITAMMLTGGIGLTLIAIGTPTTFVLGAVLAFSAGWGWTGLLLATTLRLAGCKAENAGHTVQTGIFTGAAMQDRLLPVLRASSHALHHLVWTAGSRWRIEECSQQAKNEAGLDHYRVRA